MRPEGNAFENRAASDRKWYVEVRIWDTTPKRVAGSAPNAFLTDEAKCALMTPVQSISAVTTQQKFAGNATHAIMPKGGATAPPQCYRMDEKAQLTKNGRTRPPDGRDPGFRTKNDVRQVLIPPRGHADASVVASPRRDGAPVGFPKDAQYDGAEIAVAQQRSELRKAKHNALSPITPTALRPQKQQSFSDFIGRFATPLMAIRSNYPGTKPASLVRGMWDRCLSVEVDRQITSGCTARRASRAASRKS